MSFLDPSRPAARSTRCTRDASHRGARPAARRRPGSRPDRLIPRCSPYRLAGDSLALVLPAHTPAYRTISCSEPRRAAPGSRRAACDDDAMIDVTHFTDPGCPWAYSASPALATLQWRYGDQLRWTLVTIGLAEDAELYAKRG